ncbi:MAG TPA: hypothetical protein VG944_14435 [Fimbriimonas sp.]|nr:hypothetical protein [Fimbriimonas sp.]
MTFALAGEGRARLALLKHASYPTTGQTQRHLRAFPGRLSRGVLDTDYRDHDDRDNDPW